MSNSIDSFSSQSTSPLWPDDQPQQVQPSEGQGRGDAAAGIGPDFTLDISEQAQKALEQARDKLQKAQESRESPWYKHFKLATGTTTLANGNKQVVTLDGDHMTLEEYEGDKLVKKVEGTLNDDGVVLDTEIYGENGEVSQTIHTALSGLDEAMDTTSSAHMSRSIQWFDDGELVRQMSDSMTLESDYAGFGSDNLSGKSNVENLMANGTLSAQTAVESGMTAQPDTLEGLMGQITMDTQRVRYSANIQEYANGRLSQDVHINQKNDYTNLTNRSADKFGGMDSNNTRSLAQDTSLEIQMTSYDQDGDLLREAAFSDSHQDGNANNDGQQTQSVSVAWYDKGDLVERSQGSLNMKEGKRKRLANQPSMLETLRLEEGEYASTTPRSAVDLLGQGLREAATEADHFGAPLEQDARAGTYNTADKAAERGTGDKTYRMAWKNEVYRDGDMVARQVDKESAIQNPGPTGLTFRAGGGLTENDSPAVLRRSEHTDESFENGRLEQRASIASREFIVRNDDAPDRLKTSTSAVSGTGFDRETRQAVVDSGLADADREDHAAALAMGQAIEVTMDGIANIIGRVGQDG
ncbi:hypothetical protein [Desulfocurvus sp. DL9XJH121]